MDSVAAPNSPPFSEYFRESPEIRACGAIWSNVVSMGFGSHRPEEELHGQAQGASKIKLDFSK
jgi:hypothetical protein